MVSVEGNMLKAVGFIFMNLVVTSVSYGKCIDIKKSDYIMKTPYFIEGVVKNKKVSQENNQKIVTFDLVKKRSLKGNVEAQTLQFKYVDENIKPPNKVFEEEKTYVVGYLRDDKGLVLKNSGCLPGLEIQDFVGVSKDIEIINDAAFATGLAKAYFEALLGQSDTKKIEYSATKEKDLWIVKGETNCGFFGCKKRQVSISFGSDGRVEGLNY